MSGSTENTAHSASERPGAPDRLINLGTARRMLALVGRVVGDLLQGRRRLAELRPEQDRLDRLRRTLAWPERSRRYQLREEIAAAEQQVQDARAELTVLGVAIIDAAEGRVGFPTVVNGRTAFFSWKPGEEGLGFWHFEGETGRRQIPASWAKSADISLSRKA
jgi:hypothetical protein